MLHEEDRGPYAEIANLKAEIARLQEQNRKLRDVLIWTDDNCPGKCQGRVREALIEDAKALAKAGK